MEDFLNTLLEQIRCNKAKPFIEEEIRGHIEDQIADSISYGMTKEAAEQAAIADMGSPVEIGISLDQIHRPQISWGMLALMAMISVAGIVIHSLIGNSIEGSSSFALYTAVGFTVMIGIYRIDYSVVAKFSRIIAFLFLVVTFMASMGVTGVMVNGMTFYLNLGGIHVSLFSFMMLYIPLYGSIIYKYHGTGYGGLIKSLIWMIIPCFIALRLPSLSLVVILLVSMATVLSIAIWSDWFLITKKRVIATIWGCILGLPIFFLGLAFSVGWIAAYQVDRLRAFITKSGDASYMTTLLRSYLSNSFFVGNSGNEMVGYLPNLNSNYIVAYVSSTYGIIVGIAVSCILAALIIKIFSISFKQKNQLGMIMGCGCGIVILINTTLNILENIGFVPPSQTFLPFFSAGGSGIIVCYILMGIVLSVYRYKNILPKHVDTKTLHIE
ncbi:MAG: FtsW/RodA/SpoVE family cell cycle protein [Lachnospiraceae bacterium]|nr:FtsW/RodA/SpoVE family cell cycle protein [Lachnospiraceae bacterium]